MKGKTHREVTRVLAEDLNLPIEPMLRGCVYPDQVSMKSVTIEGVEMGYPHHKETDKKIIDMLVQLRDKKLKSKELNPFSLGCLCHLIQDRAVVPYAHPMFHEMTRDIAKYKIKNDWRREDIPIMDSAILNDIPTLLSNVNPDPEEALKIGYQNSLLMLKSILQDNHLPAKFQPIYEDCKKGLEARKKTRDAYWLFTYLNPLAPFNAYLDRKAIMEKNIVKRYGYVKVGFYRKAILSLLAFLISGVAWWGVWCLLPVMGQLLTAWLKVPQELMRNLDWYIFDSSTVETPQNEKMVWEQKTELEGKQKTTILVNLRETNNGVVEVLEKTSIDLKFQTLEIGDYVIADRVCIMRKGVTEIIDFWKNNRKNLLEQIYRMKKEYEKPLLIIEGDSIYGQRNVHPNVVRAVMASIAIDYSVPIIQTRDATDTVSLLYFIAKHEQMSNHTIGESTR